MNSKVPANAPSGFLDSATDPLFLAYKARWDELSPACRAALLYLQYGLEHRFKEIAGLFAEDVDYIGPDGEHFSKRSQIAAVYEEIPDLFGQEMRIRPVNLVAILDDQALLQFDVLDQETGEYFPACIHHFTVDDEGKVKRWIPYFQTAHFNKLTHNNRK